MKLEEKLNIQQIICKCKKILIIVDENYNISAIKNSLKALELESDYCCNGK